MTPEMLFLGDSHTVALADGAAMLGVETASVWFSGSLWHDGNFAYGVDGFEPVEAPMGEALLEISRKGFGVVGVTDDAGLLAGIVTDGDLRRHMEGLLALTAGQVMTKTPRTVAPDALAETAVALMNDRKITCLFVVDPEGSQSVIGLLHIHDCLRAGIA